MSKGKQMLPYKTLFENVHNLMFTFNVKYARTLIEKKKLKFMGLAFRGGCLLGIPFTSMLKCFHFFKTHWASENKIKGVPNRT